MNSLTKILAASALLAGGVAIAHAAVQNEAVIKRQEVMKTVGKNTKLLGQMAKGEIAFDADKANQAASAIATQADMVPAVFEPQASDPESAAKPDIWQNWDDFTAKAEKLKTTAQTIDVSSLDGVRAGLGQLGEACKACHSDYRVKKD
ncbi:MAG: cytochrome c [Paracoccaceae bacterium]